MESQKEMIDKNNKQVRRQMKKVENLVGSAEKFVPEEKKEQWKKDTKEILGQLLGGI